MLWVGASWTALLVFLVSAYGRGVLTLAGHHRYFSHRSFRTGRGFQLVMALAGASCLQGGPQAWAALHRHHHAHSDEPDDVISPVRHGYWWSQLHLWVATDHALATSRIGDFDDFPELLWLERHWWVVPLGLMLGLLCVGALLPDRLGTSGAQLLVWGFFMANAYMIQVASLVNAACHRFGSQPFDNGDESRNNLWVALLSAGEGWHNNHHRYPWSARHGLRWWQLDGTWLLLRALSRLGIVWDLREPGDSLPDRPLEPVASQPSGAL